MNKENIQIKIDNINKKLDKNRTIGYYFLASICIIGVLFFLSSNILFNKEMSLMSTEINKETPLNSVLVILKDRQYNTENGLVQFTVKIKNQSLNEKVNLDFEVREKTNPTEIIPSKVTKVTNSDYIITTNVAKKWEALSLTVIDKNTEGGSKGSVKLYSDVRDININTGLKEKEINEYTVEVIENEIKDIQKEIGEINTIISDKSSKINLFKENITTLENDKEYQTESEIEATENTIKSNQSSIIQLESEIKIQSEKCKEYEEKIKKLEEKMKNYQ
ncbi:MAG: hypothetical protein IJ086_01015 [Clostridium sp.]|nr:hypothetical protein [Clostridium sp.]